MSVDTLEFTEPFFTVKLVSNEPEFSVSDKTIVLNLSEHPVDVQDQSLGFLQSVVIANTSIRNVDRAVLIERFSSHANDDELFARSKRFGRWHTK